LSINPVYYIETELRKQPAMMDPSRLRKRPLEADAATSARDPGEIDIAGCATIAYSSEDPAHPVEHMLDGRRGPGATRWMSARPDTTEYIVIEFDRPQTISRLVYEVEETMRERTQEVRVEVSEDGGQSYRQVLVQEYNFSPGGATYQREEQRFNLRQVTHLRLSIVPNKSGSGTATLTTLRLCA
jgi:F5/8 type C domain